MRVGHFTGPRGRDRFRRSYAAAMALLPEPDETADVDTPFGTVRVLRFGPAGGSPFVLLPGKAAPASVWAANLRPLVGNRTVYALDILGGPGESIQTVPIRDTADQVRWLRAVLDALDLRRVHLVGTSMGGWLALTLAAQAPAGIASVSLLDPAQTLDRIPLRTVLKSIGAAPFAPAPLRRRFLAALGGGAEIDGDPVAEVIESAMQTWSEALPIPTFPSVETLRSVRAPVLVLLGGRSNILDAQRAGTRAQTYLPDVRVEVWDQASHALPGEFPEESSARVITHATAVDAVAVGR